MCHQIPQTHAQIKLVFNSKRKNNKQKPHYLKRLLTKVELSKAGMFLSSQNQAPSTSFKVSAFAQGAFLP